MLLNLGCGQRSHSAWINVDFSSNNPNVMAYDLKKGIPFSDNSSDVIYHSHLLEHFTKSDGRKFLSECYRVLKPGGILRIVVPDLEEIVKEYLKNLELARKGELEYQKRYEWILIELFDQMIRNESGGEMLKYWKTNPMPAEEYVFDRLGSEVKHVVETLRNQSVLTTQEKNKKGKISFRFFSIGFWKDKILRTLLKEEMTSLNIARFRNSGEIHRWMYDSYSLQKLLEEIGLRNIEVKTAFESSIPRFHEYFLDVEQDGKVRKPDSLFIEARK